MLLKLILFPMQVLKDKLEKTLHEEQRFPTMVNKSTNEDDKTSGGKNELDEEDDSEKEMLDRILFPK